MNETTSGGRPGWYPDPIGRFEHRYHNGERWTADVAVGGNRYVDPYGTTAPAAPPAWSAGSARHPARVPAVLGFILALVGLFTSWVPFVFVIGAASTVACIPLGIVALRRTSRSGTRERSGRGLAIAALVIAPFAVGMSVVGVVLTRITVRELDEYREPGLLDTQFTTCELDGGFATVTGTITNLSEDEREYVIRLQLRDGVRTVHESNVRVGPVAAGATALWSDGTQVGEGVDLDCEVVEVTGPLPFGVDPEA